MQVLMDISLLASFLEEVMSKDCNHKVRRDEPAVLIYEHHAVSVSVEDHTYIGLCLGYEFLQIIWLSL